MSPNDAILTLARALVRERPDDLQLRRFVAYAHRKRAAALGGSASGREQLGRARELDPDGAE